MTTKPLFFATINLLMAVQLIMQKYSFQTKRLGFRFLEKADLDYLVELNVDPDVRQFFPDGVQNRKQTSYFSIGFKKIGEYRLAILRDKISK